MISSSEPAYMQDSLHVEVYDEMTTTGWCSNHADVAFYIDQTIAAAGPVLELACGTGRVAVPLAASGLEVHALDASHHMLNVARRKRDQLDALAAKRLHFHEGRMEKFDLSLRFDTVIIAFRSFQMLLTQQDQLSCLSCVRNHLLPGGRLILNLFDPRHEFLAPGAPGPTQVREITHPEHGTLVRIKPMARNNDPLRQCFQEIWEFGEYSRQGELLRREVEVLNMRWTFRHEMRLLAALAGFEVLSEYSDFAGSPPAYGNEQVWILKAKTPVA